MFCSADGVGAHHGRHLPLREAELGVEVVHQAGLVEEDGGEVQEGVCVGRGLTVLKYVC